MNGWAVTTFMVGVPLIGLGLFSGLCTLAGQPLRFLLFGGRTSHPAHGWADLLIALGMIMLLLGALVLHQYPLLTPLFGLLSAASTALAALLRTRASRTSWPDRAR